MDIKGFIIFKKKLGFFKLFFWEVKKTRVFILSRFYFFSKENQLKEKGFRGTLIFYFVKKL